MLIGTCYNTVFTIDETPLLVHGPLDGSLKPFRIGGIGQVSAMVRSHWSDAVCEIAGQNVRISQGGRYLSASPDGTLEIAAEVAGEAENFTLLPDSRLPVPFGFSDEALAEVARFAAKADALRAAGEPIKLQFAAGWKAIPGFLNIDRGAHCHPDFLRERPDEYFIFPSVGVQIPIEGNFADYIFHEDFIEHIDQISQIQFLAETYRLLKPGGIHRVNTPSLTWIMRRLSDFTEGTAGVYTGEQRWGHVALLTKDSLTELAHLVGYREVIFNGKDQGSSPHAGPETRPDFDRDLIEGNLYADLVK